jgi:hypothetical protein
MVKNSEFLAFRRKWPFAHSLAVKELKVALWTENNFPDPGIVTGPCMHEVYVYFH